MDLWLWALYFLPVVGAPKVLPEVKMEGMLGGSITIECPLPETYVRIYLCRTIDKSGRCTTVVSSSKFVREEFKHRVTLEQYPDRNLFLVEMTALTKNDSGVYACGVGLNTDRGKTQQITLTVHSVYEPSWEEEPMPEPPAWFNRFLQMHMPPWFQMPPHASSLEFMSKVTTPAQRTESPQAHQASPNPSVTHRPRVSRASSVATAEPTIFLQSITTSKTSAQEGLLRLQTASYNQQTRLHRQRGSNQDPGAASGMEDQGVFVLIPTILGLILLALLGLLAKRIGRAATYMEEPICSKKVQEDPAGGREHPSEGASCWGKGSTPVTEHPAGEGSTPVTEHPAGGREHPCDCDGASCWEKGAPL
nr:fas apoptotic inhibitory molecule 3 isoform X3 [Ovis aries]